MSFFRSHHHIFKILILIGREHANQAKRAGQKRHRDLPDPNSPKLKLQALATIPSILKGNLIIIFIYLLFVHTCTQHIRGGQRTAFGSHFSFHRVRPGIDSTQAVRLGNRRFYLLSLLASPHISIFLCGFWELNSGFLACKTST